MQYVYPRRWKGSAFSNTSLVMSSTVKECSQYQVKHKKNLNKGGKNQLHTGCWGLVLWTPSCGIFGLKSCTKMPLICECGAQDWICSQHPVGTGHVAKVPGHWVKALQCQRQWNAWKCSFRHGIGSRQGRHWPAVGQIQLWSSRIRFKCLGARAGTHPPGWVRPRLKFSWTS